MATHPAGDGIAWESDVDVDRPHGKDYQYINHLAKAVQKRNSKEHEAYADATVGGEHKPGGCAILGIDDATADMTAKAGDATGYKGRGLIYDQTNNALWCWTADGTTSDDPYQLKFAPSSVCLGADWTWTAAHEFDGSVDFTGPVNVDGSVAVQNIDMSNASIDGTLTVLDQADFSNVTISGKLIVSGDVSIGGDLMDISGAVTAIFDPSAYTGQESCTFPNGMIFKQGSTNVGADNSADASFAVAFPNGVTTLTISIDSELVAAAAGNLTYSEYTLSGVTLHNGLNAALDVNWHCYGY